MPRGQEWKWEGAAMRVLQTQFIFERDDVEADLNPPSGHPAVDFAWFKKDLHHKLWTAPVLSCRRAREPES